MSNTRDTGFLRNAIQVTDQGVTFVSGSTTLMSISSSGAVTTTGVISGSNALSASFSLNSALLNGIGSVGFATTGALLEVSSSQQQISSSQQQISASLLNVVANYATTGSNSFRANQSITGSLVVSSTITAQTLVVQTVTSSIVYSSGSNLFGSALGDRQTFTGSVNITGSLSVTGSAAFSSDVVLPYSKALAFNSISNQYITADSSNLYLGAANLARLTISSSGLVGIGTTSPNAKLHINGSTGSPTYRGFVYTYAGNETLTDEVLFQAVVDGYTSVYPLYLFRDQRTNQTGTQRIFEIQGGISGVGTILTTLANGYVGIGTTSPQASLHIAGKANTTALTIGASNGYEIFITGSDSANIYHASPNQAIYLNTNGGFLHLGTSAASTLLTISGSSVGIGTTSPDSLLQIGSTTVSSGGAPLRIYGYDGAADFYTTRQESTFNAALYLHNNPSGVVGNGTGILFRARSSSTDSRVQGAIYTSWTTSTDASRTAKLVLQTVDSGTNSDKVTILGNGNVGIGSTNPVEKFVVYKAASSIYSSVQGDNNASYDIAHQYYDGTNAVYSGMMRGSTGTTGSYTIFTGGATRINVTSGGNVGIGTTSPTATLQVRGPNAVGTFFDAQNVGAGGAVFSRINASSSPYNQYLFNNGNVGIDRTPLAKLAVLGGAVQIMGDYPHWQTIIKSAGANGTFNGALTITIPEMSTASVDGYGGYSCEVYVAGYSGFYCHAWFSGYINAGIVVSETTILRSSGGWSISQASYGTYNQGFTFTIDYSPGIIHPTARIIFNKGGSPNSSEYPANSITAVFS